MLSSLPIKEKVSKQQTEITPENHNQSKCRVVTCLFIFNLFFRFSFFLSSLQRFASSSLLFILSFSIQGFMWIKGG